MIRSMVKAAAAATLQRTGVTAWLGARARRSAMPLVVGYHRVVQDFERERRSAMAPMLISTATLEKQLDWIGQRFTFADPDSMDSWLSGIRPRRKPVALVTFDDGYRDVYENAFPLLKRKGIPAVMFVVTDLVGTDGLQTHDELFLLMRRALPAWKAPRVEVAALLRDAKVVNFNVEDAAASLVEPREATRMLLTSLTQSQLYRVVEILRRKVGRPNGEAGEYRSMSWDMLAEMQRAGMRIGSHTRSHAWLTNESVEKIRNELRGSRQVLQQHLGPEIHHFAYPDGRYDDLTVREVAEAGYSFAYTTCPHRSESYPGHTIPRRLMWENSCLDAFGHFSPAVLDCQINGLFDFAAHCSSHAE